MGNKFKKARNPLKRDRFLKNLWLKTWGGGEDGDTVFANFDPSRRTRRFSAENLKKLNIHRKIKFRFKWMYPQPPSTYKGCTQGPAIFGFRSCLA